MKKRTFLAGAFVGSLVGSAVALLYAPQAGKKTRRQLQYKGEETLNKAVVTSRSLCKKGNKAVSDVSELAKGKAEVLVVKAKEVINK